MRIVSWNVNGIRSIHRKGFLNWLRRDRPDVLGLQEMRATDEDLPAELRRLRAWTWYTCPARRAGYSGTAVLSRHRPRRYASSLGVPELDAEGRLQELDFGAMVLFNVYFPNGSGKGRDNSRVPFKLAFYRRLFDHIEQLRGQGREVVVMGDFNTAHREIDLRNWRSNQTTSGFLPEERRELDRWLQSGLIDTFRHVHGDVPGAYSWWSNRPGVRERNVGWRIDYVLITPGLLPHLRAAFILQEVFGSDHCPVGIELDIEVDAASYPQR
ncbi:MAG: exodeoxyribonuclease III [Myxococcales bacterium]|nr:exodeoxyribonuclease III [Myxococcota bacterium]MDW8280254.1 exodeoxyribonuclease III [Myxococcales bacterium]